MKKQLLYIAVIISAIFIILGLACSQAAGDISVETMQTGEFSLEYELLQLIPGGHKVQIDEKGILTKEYHEAKKYGKNLITVNLSHRELAKLIEIISANDFFKLPQNVDGNTDITCQEVRRLTITYDGKSHKCEGYGSRNNNFLAICKYIEQLADY